jgi:hypothetical protein
MGIAKFYFMTVIRAAPMKANGAQKSTGKAPTQPTVAATAAPALQGITSQPGQRLQ